MLSIIHRDDHIVAVNKPIDLPTHAPAPGRTGVVELLSEQLGEKLGVHHRLDAATSGVLVFSRSDEGARHLAAAFEQRRARKRYLALVRGVVGDGTLTHYLRKRGARRIASTSGPGKQAVSHVRTLARLGPLSLLEIEPVTGRTHQIRTQLAAEGAPVVGDTLYGGGHGPGRMLLHAARLEIGGLVLEAPPPPLLQRETLTEEAVAEAITAFAVTQTPAPPETHAWRLLSGPESGLAGVRLDVYGLHAVLRCYDARWSHTALEAIARAVAGPLELASVSFKEHVEKPGKPRPDTCLLGSIEDTRYAVREHGVHYVIDLSEGLGCGLYLDQIENRLWVREQAEDAEVLNLFAYTCGFSVAAAVGGARRTTSVDLSRKALSWARESFAANGLEAKAHRFFSDDVFDALARAARRGDRYDLIVCDPPSFARSKKKTFRVQRDYPELVEGCARIAAPGARLLLCMNHAGSDMDTLESLARAGLNAANRAPVSLERVAGDGAGTLAEISGTALKALRVHLDTRGDAP